MKIENFRTEENNSRVRVSASVTWENVDRQSLDVFIETDEKFAASLDINPHSFLIPGAVTAMHHAEERVYIDAEICPELNENLTAALQWIRHWYESYPSSKNFLRIDAKGYCKNVTNHLHKKAGFFLSGGVDSLATLRSNRLRFPSNHPGFFKYGLFVQGLEIENPKIFEYVRKSMSDLAKEAGFTLIPVYTNMRSLDDDWTFWGDEFEGAVFASIAHAFSKLFSVVSLASTFEIPYVHPHGSHPLLDCNYSSYDLRIRHDLITLSRLEKIRLLSDWDPALRHLRVCQKSELYQSNQFNCSQCEKCVRTMMELLVFGALDRSTAFQKTYVTEEMVNKTISLTDTTYPFYPELYIALVDSKRYDLARAVQQKIVHYKEPKWKTNLKKIVRYKEPEWKTNSKIGFMSLLLEIDRIFFKDKLKQNHGLKKLKGLIFS